MQHQHAFQLLRTAIDSFKRNDSTVAAFCITWRAQDALLADLPQRYYQVLEDLLGRLEAGSLFTEESCSFSQVDLIENLAQWLAKAEQTVKARSAE